MGKNKVTPKDAEEMKAALAAWEKGQNVYHGKNGKEYPRPEPVEMPIGAKKPESLEQKLRKIIRSEKMQAAVSAAGYETFEDANDFDTGEEDLTSGFELPEDGNFGNVVEEEPVESAPGPLDSEGKSGDAESISSSDSEGKPGGEK